MFSYPGMNKAAEELLNGQQVFPKCTFYISVNIGSHCTFPLICQPHFEVFFQALTNQSPPYLSDNDNKIIDGQKTPPNDRQQTAQSGYTSEAWPSDIWRISELNFFCVRLCNFPSRLEMSIHYLVQVTDILCLSCQNHHLISRYQINFFFFLKLE